MLACSTVQEADFALADLSVTAERATVSDYTKGFYFGDFILLTSRPDPTPVGWTFYFRPFHWLVYVLLGCGLMVMTAVLVWLERRYVRVYNCSHTAEDRKSEPSVASSVVEAVETLFGAMFGRGKQMTELSKQVCQHSTPLPFEIVTLYSSLMRYFESSFTWPFKKNTYDKTQHANFLGKPLF